MAEELSLKPMTELLGLAFRVAFTICISVSGAGWPSRTSWAPKNQCRLHSASISVSAVPHTKCRISPHGQCLQELGAYMDAGLQWQDFKPIKISSLVV